MIKKKIIKHYYNWTLNKYNFFFFEFIDEFLFDKKYTVSFHQTKKTTYINHKKKYIYSVDFSFLKKGKKFFFLKFSKYFFFKKKFIKSLYNFFYYNTDGLNLNYTVYKKAIKQFVLKK